MWRHPIFDYNRPPLPVCTTCAGSVGRLAGLFRLDALRGVGHFYQPLLGDQLPGGLADTVGFVLDPHDAISRLRMNFI